MSTVTEQQTPAQESKTELKPLNKNMRMTAPYKKVTQEPAKNKKQDEKQNAYEV